MLQVGSWTHHWRGVLVTLGFSVKLGPDDTELRNPGGTAGSNSQIHWGVLSTPPQRCQPNVGMPLPQQESHSCAQFLPLDPWEQVSGRPGPPGPERRDGHQTDSIRESTGGLSAGPDFPGGKIGHSQKQKLATQTHKIKPKERKGGGGEIEKKRSSSSVCSTIPLIFQYFSSRYRKKSQGHWTKRNGRPPSFVAVK